MDPRSWLYQREIASVGLMALLGEGAASILAFQSFKSVPSKKPFVVNKSSTTQPELKDDGRTIAAHTNFQVWVHDDPGDYLAIDAVLKELKGVIEDSAGDETVIRGEWLETSEDLEDSEMGTILRYCRFRVVHKT